MELKGLFTAIVTPFKSDGSLDKDAFRKMIEHQVSNNVAGIVPCTVTGECATLTYNEHDWVVELTVKYVNKRTLVIASTGSNCTQEAVRLSLHAQKAGSDAVFLITPYLNIPTQKGLYLHFKTIAEKLDIPCILFNLKTQTHVNLETDTLLRLADDCPNIIGMCEAGQKWIGIFYHPGGVRAFYDAIQYREKESIRIADVAGYARKNGIEHKNADCRPIVRSIRLINSGHVCLAFEDLISVVLR